MFSGVQANLIQGLIGVPAELESPKFEKEMTTRKTTEAMFGEPIAKDFFSN